MEFRWAKIDSATLGAGHTDTWNMFYLVDSNAGNTQPAWKNVVTDFTFNSSGQLTPPLSTLTLNNVVVNSLSLGNVQLVFGNGSDEVLHLLAMTYLQPGDHTVQGDPSFAMYEIYTQQCNATPIKDQSQIRFVRKDYADVELRVPNVDKARELLGFEAQIDLDEGIRRTGAHYRETMGSAGR